MHFLTEPVQIYRANPGTSDDEGNPADAFMLVATTVGYFEQVQTADTANSDRQRTQHRLIVGPDVDLRATDEVLIRGRVFVIDGRPAEFRRPGDGASVHHLEVELREVRP